jgi:hypothetical protein
MTVFRGWGACLLVKVLIRGLQPSRDGSVSFQAMNQYHGALLAKIQLSLLWLKDFLIILLCVTSHLVTEDKSVTELNCPEGSQIVLDVWNDTVICTRSFLKSPPNLVLGKLPSKGSEHRMLWTAVTSWQPTPSLDSLICHYMALTQEEESQASCSKFLKYFSGCCTYLLM